MSPLLGIDYGLRRVGIAVSDATDTLASPLATHHEGRDGSLVERLRRLVEERGITAIVLGHPLTTRAEEGEIARRVRRFASVLREALALPVILVDERYSSREAAACLRRAGVRRSRGAVDAVAAALVLQVHLDRQRAERGE